MPVAPTFETLFDFETHVEGSVGSLVSGSVLVFGTPGSMDDGTTPAIKSRFVLGEVSGHINTIYNSSGSASKYYYDTYNGLLEVSVITDRGVDSSYHSQYVSKVRYLLSDYHNYNSYLTYHEILDVVPAGSIRGIDDTDSKSRDITTLNFNLKVCVKPESWPTSSV